MSDGSHDRWHSAPGLVALKRHACFRAFRENALTQIATSELRRELPHGRRVPEFILRLCAPARLRLHNGEHNNVSPVVFHAELFNGSLCSFWIDTGRRELLISGNLRFLVKEQNGDAFDYRFVPEERRVLRGLFPSGASVSHVKLLACYIRTPSRVITVHHGEQPDSPHDPVLVKSCTREERSPSDIPPSN